MSAGPRTRLARWLGAAAVALLCAAPAAGQQPQDEIIDRQLAYNAARSQYQAALDAWRVVEKQWTDAVDEHEAGRRAGDEERQNAALVRALDKSRELDLSERRVADLRSALDRARTGLLAAIDVRLEQIDGQLGAARTTAERTRFAATLRDLQNQRDEVDVTRDEPAVRMVLLYYPSIQFDVRDTPEEMTGKAQLLRSKATKADAYVAQIDAEIANLEKQRQRSRNVEGFVAGLDRFGDVEPPVGAVNRRPAPDDARARPDSAGVARPEVTPDEQLRVLRLLRVQVLEAKRQFLERAATFEDRVRRIG